MTELSSHLGVFLREHLPRDRNASRHTVQSYADSFQLLVCFAAERLGVRPCRIEVEQLTAPLILDFLDSLERERNNAIGTRNVRLAAFKSFFRYLEFRVPACLDLARQVHAIPTKRGDEAMVESLNRDEVWALLDAPDPTTAAGVRDRAMLHLTYAAGLRVSELIGLMYTDLARPHLDTVVELGEQRLVKQIREQNSLWYSVGRHARASVVAQVVVNTALVTTRGLLCLYRNRNTPRIFRASGPRRRWPWRRRLAPSSPGAFWTPPTAHRSASCPWSCRLTTPECSSLARSPTRTAASSSRVFPRTPTRWPPRFPATTRWTWRSSSEN